MPESMKDITVFYKKAERLKTTLRHSWLSDNNRRESVADHVWMLAMLALVLFDRIETKVDQLKVLKMIIVHDLAEALTGDIPLHDDASRGEKKYEAEEEAFRKILSDLNKNLSDEIVGLWKEYTERKTPEAKLAKALDKIEALMQHNVAGIETWDEGDFRLVPYGRNEYFEFDSFLKSLKEEVEGTQIEMVSRYRV